MCSEQAFSACGVALRQCGRSANKRNISELPICRMATTELQNAWLFAEQKILERGVGAVPRWTGRTPVPVGR